MISFLKGTIVSLNNQSLTLTLNQLGLGLEIFTPKNYAIAIGQELTLFTYMHWNQEQGPSMYGFLTENEKKIFEMVIGCSGIGPKIGLAVLSEMDPKDFIHAINEQDIKALSSINGIGAKKAEQIIMQLKHKIGPLLDSGLISDKENYKHIKGINDVLNSLNYSRTEIANALDHLRTNYSSQNYSFDQMLKQALSFLSKKI
jgi:Holliday junction DNA helicase RuvA